MGAALDSRTPTSLERRRRRLAASKSRDALAQRFSERTADRRGGHTAHGTLRYAPDLLPPADIPATASQQQLLHSATIVMFYSCSPSVAVREGGDEILDAAEQDRRYGSITTRHLPRVIFRASPESARSSARNPAFDCR